jgi:hypothetical protein
MDFKVNHLYVQIQIGYLKFLVQNTVRSVTIKRAS